MRGGPIQARWHGSVSSPAGEAELQVGVQRLRMPLPDFQSFHALTALVEAAYQAGADDKASVLRHHLRALEQSL